MQYVDTTPFRLRAYALRRDWLPPTPDVGALIVFFVYEWFRCCRGSTTRYGYVARETGSEFRSPAAHQLPDKFAFIGQRVGFFRNVADISAAYKIFGPHIMRGE